MVGNGGGSGARGIGIAVVSNVYLHYGFDLWADQSGGGGTRTVR